ncbi:MAG TPA: hypothetical protein VGX68_03330 [Thermoanaerobaculia bacterium]|jgi:hypothetical protein|nr:hypothetical protein [Thermoanaerobaculia bacterium]
MKKSTVVKVLCAIVLVVVLVVAAGGIVAARSYVDCASRIISSAPPTDARPPAIFRSLSRAFWGNRDIYLARVLLRECKSDGHNARRSLRSQTFALAVVKGRLSFPERVTLSSIFLPAYGGRGLTRSAHAEWGRPPASLSEAEMMWLFVIGQEPGCSKQRPDYHANRQMCEGLYQSYRARLDASVSP